MDTAKRSSNFTREETELLLHLVCEYKDILDRKETDKATIEEKNRVWENITEEFNAQNLGDHRNIKVLKKKFNNLKRPKISVRKVDLIETPSSFLSDFKKEKEVTIDSTLEKWSSDSRSHSEALEDAVLEDTTFVDTAATVKKSRLVELAEEKHKLEMEILREEHQKKMKMMEEKHKLEVELLKYQIRVEKNKI